MSVQVCWCADPQCKINGCRLGKTVWDKDRFTKDASKVEIRDGVYDWWSVYTDDLKEKTELETLTEFEETVLQMVDFLKNKGVTEEEILKRLLQS